MKRSSIIWLIVILAAAGWLAYRASTGKMGKSYVREVEVVVPIPGAQAGEPPATWTRFENVDPKLLNDPDPAIRQGVILSWPRTIGLWVAALSTLAILSFLIGDNPLYRLAESVFVGSSAAYLMVVGFWTGIVQNLFGKLIPDLLRQSVLPGLSEDQHVEIVYLVPLILGLMMIWRLAPVGSWIARWPLAFFIGATAGFRLLSHLEADFIAQIQASVVPLYVTTADGSFDLVASLKNTTIIIGVLTCLTYFFFSVHHKGVVGGIARVGVWFLMVTFGAGFGYTVMGRIALLAARLEFLFDDWLWLIDPAARRLGL
jgi:hypothetical protein